MEQRPNRARRRLLSAAAVLLAVSVVLTYPVPPARRAVTAMGAAGELEAMRPADVSAAGVQTARVVPLGRTVGIKLFSDGVLVVGMSDVRTAQNTVSPAKEMGLKVGDVITRVNDREVDTIEEMQDAIRALAGEEMTLQVTREDRELSLCGAAVETQPGAYQLGAWIRDSMAGIGTVTFYEPSTGRFAALGHGINDVDTARLMTMQSGSIMRSTVTGVKKGESGDPGELHGSFDLTGDLGQLSANTEAGVFGTLTDENALGGGEAVEIARRSQVRTGPATILSNVDGDVVREYQAEIVHLYPATADKMRNLMIRVTDPELLAATGGIVQGMSGSPILQSGRLVGAVTHVLVNDPTRGYGILAENMIDRMAL